MKKFLALLLSAALLIPGMPADTFAAGSDEPRMEAAETVLERGKTYMVPITRYDGYGDPINWEAADACGKHHVAPQAMVSVADDGDYHVTLEWANYYCLDTVQFFKQEAIPEGTEPRKVAPGTYGIDMDGRFKRDISTEYKKPETGAKVDFTNYLKAMLDESQNEKIYQDVKITEDQRGVSYIDLKLQDLEKWLYFREIATVRYFHIDGRDVDLPGSTRNERDPAEAFPEELERSVLFEGAFGFEIDQAQEVPGLDAYKTGKVTKIVQQADKCIDDSGYGLITLDDENTDEASALIKDEVAVTVNDDGSIRAEIELENGSGITAVREGIGIAELGEATTYTGIKIKNRELHTRSVRRYHSNGNAGEDGSTSLKYSDNLLDNGKVTLDFASAKEAAWGKILYFSTGHQFLVGSYEFVLRLQVEDNTLSLSSNGMGLKTTTDVLDKDVQFSADILTEGQKYENIQKLLYAYSAKNRIYSPALTLNGEAAAPSTNVDVSIAIPEGWEAEKSKISLYSLTEDSSQGDLLSPVNKFQVSGNTCVFSTKNLNQVYVLSQNNTAADLSQLSLEDGIYDADVAFWSADGTNQMSMSHGAIIPGSSALVVKDGKYRIYFKLQGIQVGTQKAHVKNMYIQYKDNSTSSARTDVDYYSYVRNEAKDSVYNIDYYGETYGYCYPELFSFELPARLMKRDEVKIDFYVPVMAELSGMTPDQVSDPVKQNCTKQAVVKLYNIEKSESTAALGYEASWLLKSIEDAETLMKAADPAKKMYRKEKLDAFTAKLNAARGEMDTMASAKIETESKEIQDAAAELVKISLEDLIARADRLQKDDYDEENYQTMASALESAKGASESQTMTVDEQNRALRKLYDAVEELQGETSVNKEGLLAALNTAKTEAAKTDTYTPASIQALQGILEAAQNTYDNPDATHAEVDEQVKNLQAGLKGLVSQTDSAKAELRDSVENALKETNDGTYTENSWNSYQAAIASAQKLLADENAAKEAIEKQKRLLSAVKAALVQKDSPNAAYPVAVKLLNAMSDEPSMGNGSMVQAGTIRVSDEGEMTLELDFQAMQFTGLTGYLYKFKKVDMDSVERNAQGYPVSYAAQDAQILEEYVDFRDQFNDSGSQYYDENTGGNWYPKKLSIPIKREENLFYVEIYVPVMESIGTGQGTKVARLSIDWAGISNRDDSVLEALLNQISQMTADGMSQESWNVLQAASLTAEEVRANLNAAQQEIDLQAAALQAAIDAVVKTGTETQPADKTALNALIQRAQTESARAEVYTAETLAQLKTAIDSAKAVAEKETAAQAEVDAQVKALQAAIDALQTQPEPAPTSRPGTEINRPSVSVTPSPQPSEAPATPTPGGPTPGADTETIIKDDGTKVTTTTTVESDGSKKEEMTEERPDGSKVESTTVTNADGSSQKAETETAADGTVIKTTTTETAADGSATKTENTTENNSKGAEVAKTVVTGTDAAGNVTGVKETSVFAPAANTEATVTVTKDGSSNITAARASIVNTKAGNRVTLSAEIAEQVTEAAGREDVVITLTATKDGGAVAYQVTVNASNIKSGDDLYVYAYNKKTKEYILVNARTYTVTGANLNLNLKDNKANEIYRLVDNARSAALTNRILKTVKPAKASVSVKRGKKASFTLSSKLNRANVKSITYSTSKKSVAAVNKNGRITAKKKGTATVRAKVTLKNGRTKTVKMKVRIK